MSLQDPIASTYNQPQKQSQNFFAGANDEDFTSRFKSSRMVSASLHLILGRSESYSRGLISEERESRLPSVIQDYNRSFTPNQFPGESQVEKRAVSEENGGDAFVSDGEDNSHAMAQETQSAAQEIPNIKLPDDSDSECEDSFDVFEKALESGLHLPQVVATPISREFISLQFQQFHLKYSYVYLVVFFGTSYLYFASLDYFLNYIDSFQPFIKHGLGIVVTTLLYLLVGNVFTLFLFMVDRHLNDNYNPWVPRRKLPKDNNISLKDLTTQVGTEFSLKELFGPVGIAQGTLVYVAFKFGSSSVSWGSSCIDYMFARAIQAVIIDFVFYVMHFMTHTKRFYYLHKRHHNNKYMNIFTAFEQNSLDAILDSWVTLGVSDILLLFCGQFQISGFWVIVMQLWPLYASIAVHLPYEVFLFSRWCDFCPILDMFLGMDSATMDHIGHHYLGMCNYGAFAITDRMFDTHVSLVSTYRQWRNNKYRAVSAQRRAAGIPFHW